MNKLQSINMQIEGVNVIVLATNGKVDQQALEKIRVFLQKQKTKELAN